MNVETLLDKIQADLPYEAQGARVTVYGQPVTNVHYNEETNEIVLEVGCSDEELE